MNDAFSSFPRQEPGFLVSRLFQYEEENPTGPSFCCSLRSGVCMKGRVRGRERGRESEREGICLAALVRVCDASEEAPPTPWWHPIVTELISA